MFPDALLDRFAPPIRALLDRKRALTWRLIRIVLALLAGGGTAFAHPPFGVLIGLLVLAQTPTLVQLAGIALVVLAGAAAQRGGRRSTDLMSTTDLPATPAKETS